MSEQGASLSALIREVSEHLQFNLEAYGKVWTGEDEDTRFICGPLVREVERLRSALALIAAHARRDESERGFGEATRYYGIAEDALGDRR